MKGLKIISCLMVVALVQITFADRDTVITDTLQQGLNQYMGCQDAYIYRNSSSSNYGDKPTVDMIYQVVSS